MISRLPLLASLIAAATLAAPSLAQAPVPRLKPPVENHSEILGDADFANFRRGMAAAEEDEWDEVRTARRVIANEVAKNVLLWRIAISDPRAAFSELDLALDELQGWPMRWNIPREAEWKIEDSGLSAALIVDWFEGREPVTGEGRVALGEALIEIGRSEEGEAQIVEAWRTQVMRLSAQDRTLSRHGELFTAEDHAARVDMLLWNGQRTAASRLLPQLSEGERRVATARIRLAARSSGVDAAVDAVPDSLTTHPGLLYERARWRRQAGLETDLPLLLELPDSYHDSGALAAMWTERKLQILDLLRDGDVATAYELAAANGMSEGVDFADAEFLAGWLALTRLGEPEQALAHFDRLEAGVSTPVSLGRAKYWQGRAAEAAGDLELARERFLAAAQHATTYYGQLALLALGPDAATLSLPPDPEITNEQRAAFEARADIQALRLLGELGEDYYFRVFIYHLDDEMTSPAETAMLSDIALEFFRLRQAVRAAKAGRMQGMTLAERAYPVIDLPDAAPIFPEAALTHSVIRQETEFDARAVSSAGARGMMQMMPATARETARAVGQPYNFQWLTDDPDYNLTLGMAHLDEVTSDYDGALILALAAYNAGGHRVRRWVEEYGDPRTGAIDPIDWVEHIPFSETRNYVMRVLENLQVYRARMSTDATAPLLMERDMVGEGGASPLPALPEEFIRALEEMDALAAEAEAAAAEAAVGGPTEGATVEPAPDAPEIEPEDDTGARD